MAWTTAAVALGSNLGDRRAHLDFAVHRLQSHLKDLRVSGFFDTEPVGVAPQPVFLNGAVVGTTSGTARGLLDALLAIEAERGRVRPHPGAPRTLDLDLILFGSDIVSEPGLVVPHPRFRDRLFVLRPLADIAPNLVDPVSGRTIRDLLARVEARASGS